MSEESKKIELLLLKVTKQFLQELKAEQASRILTLNSTLEHDLGLGSLERVELARRIESAFSIRVSLMDLEKIRELSEFLPLINQSLPTKSFQTQAFTQILTESKLNPAAVESLTQLVNLYAEQEPSRPHIYLQNDEGREEVITYGELALKAKQAASIILNHSIKPGETIAIMLPTCREYFYFFLGILFAGAIPVPIYPPTPTDRIEDYVKRQSKVLQNAEIRLLITLTRGKPLARILKTFIPSLYEVLTIEDLKNSSLPTEFFSANPGDGALIQYTSGSTGDPKGVFLTHSNLLANIRACGQALQVKPNDVMISWLPLYHDMGLIGSWLGSLYFGIPVCIFSPLLFLMRPERWLWAIHYHRGTISGAPNFAYELCVNALSPEKLSGLDLSCWRLALNGSETVHASSLHKFSNKFAAYQFDPKAMAPAYGLAESTMALIFPPPGRGPKIDIVKADVFMQTGQAEPADPTDKATLEIVSCGEPLPAHAVRIVNDKGDILKEREAGSLQFQGPSSMPGYFHNTEATQRIMHDGWIDSGDLAYFADGEIYITGRKKDVIILAGRNIHPEEIERIAGDIPGIISGGVIAFAVSNLRVGTEQCIVVAETEEKHKSLRQKLIKKLIADVAGQLNISISEVILVNPHTVPKTASGKVQRSACKQDYLQGRLKRNHKAAWVQKIKLISLALRGKIRNTLSYFVKGTYTIYAGLIALISGLVFFPILMLTPSNYSQKVAKIWARIWFFMIFTPVNTQGSVPAISNQGAILASNHASYLDVFLLLAALPVKFTFIAKHDLADVPVLGRAIKKINSIFVNRMDFVESIEDIKRIQQVVAQGHNILIFPEATFSYSTGLRAFKLGAFKLAVDLQVPLYPIALKGTRLMLRSPQFLLSPQKLSVFISEPLLPQKLDWDEIVKLRDLTRQQIALHCGEQTLDLISAEIAKH